MANVIQFTIRGVDEFSSTFGKIGGVLKTATKAIAITTTALAGASAAAFAFTNRIARAQDQTAKFASLLGVTTEALSKLHFAAELAGLDVRTFDMAMQRSTRRVAEAAKGIGEARGAIRELGLTARDLARQSPDQQFLTLTEALTKVEGSSERVRLAFKLFDSEGVRILQTINKDSDAFRKAAVDLEFLGGVIGRQAAANAEEFRDEMTRVRTAVFGVSQVVANQLTPIFTGAMRRIANAIAEARPAIEEFTGRAIRGFLTVALVARQVGMAIFAFFKSLFTIEGWLKLFEGLGAALRAAGEHIARIAPALGRLLLAGFEVAFLAILTLARGAFTTLFELAAVILPKLPEIMLRSFQIAFRSIAELGKTAFQKLFDVFTGQDLAPAWTDTLTRDIPEATAEARAQLGEAIGAMDFRGVFDPIRLAFTEGIGEATRDARERFAEAAPEFLAVARDTGAQLAQQLASAFGVDLEVIKTQVEELIASVSVFGQAAAEATKAEVEEIKTFMDFLLERHREFLDQQRSFAEEFATSFHELLLTTVDAIGERVGAVIVEGATLVEVFKAIAQSVLKSLIAILVKLALQRLLTAAIFKAANVATAAGEMATGLAQTYVNAFKSTAAIPIIGPALAPGVAAASVAVATAGATAAGAAGTALGAKLAGGAQAGLERVPTAGTFLLHPNERVLAAEQNRDLTNFLREERDGGGQTVIEQMVVNVSVLPNATNADALLRMDPERITEIVAGPIIQALNRLDRVGIRPEFAERRRI